MSNKNQIQMYFACQPYRAWMPVSMGSGMNMVILTRKSTGGAVVGVNFLCDTFCLGVKDCTPFLTDEAHLPAVIAYHTSTQMMREVSPGYLVKFVVELVKWARNIGFEPHQDFKFCKEILLGIKQDAEATFEFGQNGIPLYMNGPYDTPERIRSIVNTLEAYKARTGHEVNFMLMAAPDMPLEIGEQDLIALE